MSTEIITHTVTPESDPLLWRIGVENQHIDPTWSSAHYALAINGGHPGMAGHSGWQREEWMAVQIAKDALDHHSCMMREACERPQP